MVIAVRIIPMNDSYSYDDPIDFYEEEVRDGDISLPKTNIIQGSQKQAPYVYDTAKTFGTSAIEDRYILPLQIFHAFGTTRAKVESLFDYNLVYKVYYTYNNDTTKFKLVSLIQIEHVLIITVNLAQTLLQPYHSMRVFNYEYPRKLGNPTF